MKLQLGFALALASTSVATAAKHRGVSNSEFVPSGKLRAAPHSHPNHRQSRRKLGKGAKKFFRRASTFPVCRQIDAQCNDDTETVAEILYATDDGMTVVYTDSEREVLGFVDISDIHQPAADGVVALPGEPTSVAIKGNYALVAVNTSTDYVNTSGQLVVVDISTKTIVRSFDLGGQPDSISVSPDKEFCAIAIENERDEDLGDGEIPQFPPGFVVVLSIGDADPSNWPNPTIVVITGLDGVIENGDPEPEYVSINEDNIAVVTLQENNAAVLIDLETRNVIDSFTMGEVSLDYIDTIEDNMINQVDSLSDIRREPDGVTWISDKYFVTANEGDMVGGSRGFTVFNKKGKVVWDSGNEVEHIVASIGHYNDDRSENKGAELENVAYSEELELVFVNSERSNVVLVYDVSDPKEPEFHQVLPTGVGPEGGYYIPSRDLLVVACEVDSRDDKIRASVVIYEYGWKEPNYPTLISVESDIGHGVPIPWVALSGLSGPYYNDYDDRKRKLHKRKIEDETLYAVDDSAFQKNRIFTIDASEFPAVITDALYITDANGVFASFPPYGDFDAADLAAMINADDTVNIDPEGIAATSDGGFWIASEGRGTIGDTGRPIESLNFLFKVDSYGVIEDVVSLPDYVNDIQVRFGFEGVAVDGDFVIVAFQRAWIGESDPRIGIYNTVLGSWKFVFYPLDAVESQAGGWVGLSDITALGGGNFLVVERDNQGGPDAAIKKIYGISLGDIDGFSENVTLTKILVRDLVGDLMAPGGQVYEKIEGMAYLDGDIWIVNDNDAVDDNSGETQLLNLGEIFDD